MDNAKQIVTLAIFLVLIVGLQSCGSISYEEKKKRIDDQIWQCNELYNSGTVSMARIEGLNCMGRAPQTAQQPVIINNVIPQAQPIIIQQPQVQYIQQPAVQTNYVQQPKQINTNGYTVKSSTGTPITSTTILR